MYVLFIDVLYDETKKLFLNTYIVQGNEINGKFELKDTRLEFHLKEKQLAISKALALTTLSHRVPCHSLFEYYLAYCCVDTLTEMVAVRRTIYSKLVAGIVTYSMSVIFNFGGIIILLHSGTYSSSPFIYYFVIMFNDTLVLTFKIRFPFVDIFFCWDHHEFYLFEFEHFIYSSKYVYIAFFERTLKAFGAWMLVLLYVSETRIILSSSKKVEKIRISIAAILIIFILAITLHFPVVWLSNYTCEYTPNRIYLFVLFLRYVYWWYAVSAGLLPFIVMTGCNMAIIVHIIDVQYFKIMRSSVTDTNKMGKQMYRQLLIGCVFIFLTSPLLLYDALNKGSAGFKVSSNIWNPTFLMSISEYICKQIDSIN